MEGNVAKNFETTGAMLPRDNWAWFVARGALALMLGVAAIPFPLSALYAFTLLFAAFAVTDGLASLVSGFKGARRKQDRWVALILRGLVGILVGVVFVLMPFVTTVSYALASLALVAVWSIAAGIFEISAAIRLRKEIKGEWLLALSGLLSILLGAAIPVMMVLAPVASIMSVAWIIGVYAIAAGVLLIVQGMRLRRASRERGNERSQAAVSSTKEVKMNGDYGRDGLVIGLLLLGAITLASSWLLGFSGHETAAISASAIGALLIVAAIPVLGDRAELSSAAALTVGGWSLIAPILLGFTNQGTAFTAHAAAGVAAMLLAIASESWRSQGPPEIRV